MQDDPYAPPQQSIESSGQRGRLIQLLIIPIVCATLAIVCSQILQSVPVSTGLRFFSWRTLFHSLVTKLIPLGLIAWTYRDSGRIPSVWCSDMAVLLVVVCWVPDIVLTSMSNPTPGWIRLVYISREFLLFLIAFLVVASVAQKRFSAFSLLACSGLATVFMLTIQWSLQWMLQSQLLAGNSTVWNLWMAQETACWTICLGLLAPLVCAHEPLSH